MQSVWRRHAEDFIRASKATFSVSDDLPTPPSDLETIARGGKYPPAAYQFVLESLAFARTHVQYDPQPPYQRGGHLDATDLCWCLHDYALQLFGAAARQQLHQWKIDCCGDIGQIVYRLIEFGLAAKTEGESIEDFADVFDFDEQFHYDPAEWEFASGELEASDIHVKTSRAEEEPERSPPQMRLRTLLGLVTILAILLGWIAIELQRTRSQRPLVAAIRQHGGQVYYRNRSTLLNAKPFRNMFVSLAGEGFGKQVNQVGFELQPLTASAVRTLQRLPDLEGLIVRQGNIDADAFQELHKLRKLKRLDICSATLDDAALEHISRIDSLQQLELNFFRTPRAGGVTDVGVGLLAKLRRLRRLSLVNAPITDAGLATLGNLPQLTSLELWHTQITARGFSGFAKQAPLKTLSMHDSPVDDASLQSLSRLSKLTSLLLDGTQVTDAAMPSLRQFAHLENLTLVRAEISREGLAQLSHLPRLRVLTLRQTGVTVEDALAFEAAHPDIRLLHEGLWLRKMLGGRVPAASGTIGKRDGLAD